jgi:DNA invertase Pin-like site-specific DNA recombinase
MKIGYARVSTPEQSLSMQRYALKQAGCEKIFSDTASGVKSARAGLEKAIEHLRPGDTLVVWKLDRLGRSLKDLISIVKFLQEKKIGFHSLQETIDTTTSGGKLIFHVFSALAEFERDVIRERTKAGLQAARARGRLGGRPFLLAPTAVKRLRKLYDARKNTVIELCKIFNISRPSFYNYLKDRNVKVSKKKRKAKVKAGKKSKKLC